MSLLKTPRMKVVGMGVEQNYLDNNLGMYCFERTFCSEAQKKYELVLKRREEAAVLSSCRFCSKLMGEKACKLILLPTPHYLSKQFQM